MKSGSKDDDYEKVRTKVVWDDPSFIEMGKNFAKLHTKQMESIKAKSEKAKQPAEFSRKALSLSIVAGWAFAAGIFQNNPTHLKTLYSLPDNMTGNNDPLNAKALSEAKHKGHDPEKYRGLGTRTNASEIGRILELFILLADNNKKKIDKQLANAAIMSFEAKKAASDAQKMKAKL